jgi:hypothetical protein
LGRGSGWLSRTTSDPWLLGAPGMRIGVWRPPRTSAGHESGRTKRSGPWYVRKSMRRFEPALPSAGSIRELDHAQCVPNSNYEPAFMQVEAISSEVCKTVPHQQLRLRAWCRCSNENACHRPGMPLFACRPASTTSVDRCGQSSHRGGQGFKSPQLHLGQRPVPNAGPAVFDVRTARKYGRPSHRASCPAA